MHGKIQILKRKIVNGSSLLILLFKRQLRQLRGLEIVHVIGDSHSLLFQDSLFKIHYIGSATAYRLGSDTSTTQSKQKILQVIKTLPRNKKNLLLFVFGEIDGRIHIYKAHREKNISIKRAIDQTVKAYINFVQSLYNEFDNIEIAIFNILPQGEQKNIYKMKYYADRDTRIQIAKQMNEALAALCRKKNIKFVSVFNELIENNDKRKKIFVFDDVHFNNKIVPFIISDLKKQKIL